MMIMGYCIRIFEKSFLKNFAKTQDKIQSFKNGYGTILFFEDEKVTKALMQKFPLYKILFGLGAGCGMFQHVWTAMRYGS